MWVQRGPNPGLSSGHCATGEIMRTFARVAVVAALVFAPLGVLGGIAGAAAPAGTLALSSSTIAPEEVVTLSGTGCTPVSAATAANTFIVLTPVKDGKQAAEPTVIHPAADGTWSTHLSVGAAAVPGAITLTVVCDRYMSYFQYAPATLTVVEPQSARITAITRTECRIDVHVTVGAAGNYELKVYDDKVVVSDQAYTLAQDAQAVLPFTITAPSHKRPPGIGFVVQLYKNGKWLASYDPYRYPDAVGVNCAASGGVSAEATSASPSLASTGVDLTDQGMLAGGLLLAGFGALALGRRRVARRES